MAKYDVLHTCGHEVEYSLFGKHSDRERKIEWLKTCKCTACRNKEEAEKAQEEVKGCQIEDVNNVDLKGSEKQIAWARTIRAEIIARAPELPNAKLPAFIAVFSSLNEAKYWIEHKDYSFSDIARLNTEAFKAEFAKLS